MLHGTSLAELARLRPFRRRRISSYDRTGGNYDWYEIAAGETRPIAEIAGAGAIRHIWCTLLSYEEFFLRTIRLRMFWDGETEPSVDTPIGDFFGVGHGICTDFWSLPLTMSPDNGRGFNSYWAMPYGDGARIEIVNESGAPVNFYFYIDYEEYERLDDDLARFHAQWRRENPTASWGAELPLAYPLGKTVEGQRQLFEELWRVPNLSGADNYVLLEATGRGQYVGCNLNIDCFQQEKNDWYGEGDDMIFIDGETTPSIYGTGTEDYFNTAFCPRTPFSTPYHGLTLNSGDAQNPWRGKNSVYRFHIEDPIRFETSIKVTIEHGHANKLGNDYSSTAYWYQVEPHAPFPPMLPAAERLPRVYEVRTSLAELLPNRRER